MANTITNHIQRYCFRYEKNILHSHFIVVCNQCVCTDQNSAKQTLYRFEKVSFWSHGRCTHAGFGTIECWAANGWLGRWEWSRSKDCFCWSGPMGRRLHSGCAWRTPNQHNLSIQGCASHVFWNTTHHIPQPYRSWRKRWAHRAGSRPQVGLHLMCTRLDSCSPTFQQSPSVRHGGHQSHAELVGERRWLPETKRRWCVSWGWNRLRLLRFPTSNSDQNSSLCTELGTVWTPIMPRTSETRVCWCTPTLSKRPIPRWLHWLSTLSRKPMQSAFKSVYFFFLSKSSSILPI